MSENEAIQSISFNSQLEQYIGNCLAKGMDSARIVEDCVTAGVCTTRTEITRHIKHVFNQWHELEEEVSLDKQDLYLWHIRLRHTLLMNTMESAPRVALTVLESLADLQNLRQETHAATDIPIIVQLMPKGQEDAR